MAQDTIEVRRGEWLRFISDQWPHKEKVCDLLSEAAYTHSQKCPPIGCSWLFRLLVRFGRKIELAESPEACFEAFVEVLNFLSHPEPGWDGVELKIVD